MRYWINYSVFAFAVDDKRQAQHTPVVIAEILSEEGLWVYIYDFLKFL